ncbi:MAG: hypothetical protein FWF23_01145 [Alphaproteobacteria bacterium]|nr:hypothetical protein [Alphaproteobacteria bacterium]MCL2505879.1 hypothetical protein [Alphaproteobacteria bacterium]
MNKYDHSKIKTILITTNKDGLGDALRELALLSSMRQAFPDAEITFLTRKKVWHHSPMFEPVTRNPAVIHGKQYAHPLIDHMIIEKELGRTLKGLWTRSFPLKEQRKDNPYDIVISLERGIFPPLCVRRIPHRRFISYSLLWLFSDLKPVHHKRNEKHLLQQFYACVEAASQKPAPEADTRLPISTEDEQEAERLLPYIGKKYVGQVPGAGNKSKCWSLEKHIELAKKLHQAGHIPVFILGPAEKEWTDTLKEAVPFAKFPLSETQRESSIFLTAAIANRLAAAVSNDCGTAHILASGIQSKEKPEHPPIIILFGRTCVKKHIPFTKRAVAFSASDFVAGSKNIDDIPLDTVFKTVIEQLEFTINS